MTANGKTVATALAILLTLNCAQPAALVRTALHAASASESGRDLQLSLSLCADLEAGWRLNAGESLFSALGAFRLTMQDDGNLVLYAVDDMKLPADILHVFDYTPDVLKLYAKPIWSTGTHVPKAGGGKGVYCAMEDGGNFVVYDREGRACFETRTGGHPGSVLRLQSDGNLVVYTHDLKPTWSSNTWARPVGREPPMPQRAVLRRARGRIDRLPARLSKDLKPGWRLRCGDSLYAPLGGFRLMLQDDGNLVLYSLDDTRLPADAAVVLLRSAGELGIYHNPIWWTNTHVPGEAAGRAAYCVMKDDGNFVACDEDDKVCFQTRTQGHQGAFLRCQDDGNLVIYTRENKAIWQTKTYSRVDDSPVAK